MNGKNARLSIPAIILIITTAGLFYKLVATERVPSVVEVLMEKNEVQKRQMFHKFLDALDLVEAQEKLFKEVPAAMNFHDFFHHLGEHVYDNFGAHGLKYCLDDFHMACRHGFIMYFAQKDGLEKIERIVEEAMDGKDSNVGRRIQDSHALGHVYARVYNYDLPLALKACSGFMLTRPRLSSDWCYYGVFMEEYQHANESSDWLSLEKRGIFGHCLNQEKKYRWACFTNQPRIMRHLLGDDLVKVVVACNELADSSDRLACYEGVARLPYISERRMTIETALLPCSHFPREYQEFCIVFSAQYSVWLGSNFIDFAIEVCDNQTGKIRRSCFVSVTNAVFLMYADLPIVNKFCKDTSSKQRDRRCGELLKNGYIQLWNPESLDELIPFRIPRRDVLNGEKEGTTEGF